MALTFKQGDAFVLPLSGKLNGTAVAAADIETLELMLGDLRKTYPGDMSYDAESGKFLLPLTQEETFAFDPGTHEYDLRIALRGGSVIGLRKKGKFSVVDALSEEVL